MSDIYDEYREPPKGCGTAIAGGLAIVAIAVMLLFGCVSCKTCVPVVEIHDSIRTVEVHTHDTTIVTEADSAQVRLLLRCDSTNNVLIDEISTANGERLQMQAKIRQLLNGQSALTVDCNEDSLLNIIQWQDSVIREKTNHVIVQERQVVPDYYKNTSIGFWVLLVFIVLYIVAKIVIRIYIKR